MKSSDLRIGNYVHHNINNSNKHFIGNELIVCEITENGITTFYNNIDGDKQIVRGKSNYEPIPLTEEWLIKMGFEYIEIGEEVFEQNWVLSGHEILCGPANEGLFYHDFLNGGLVQYVHTLQNLIYALTGKELTINEPISI